MQIFGFSNRELECRGGLRAQPRETVGKTHRNTIIHTINFVLEKKSSEFLLGPWSFHQKSG